MAALRLIPFGFAALLALPAMAADPALLNLVMPGAQNVAGISVSQARNTPFGQFILERMKTKDADFQRLMEQTGFDPRTDITEIVAASDGATPRDGQGLVVARGQFDVNRILAAAQKSGGSSSTYKGVQMLVKPTGKSGKQGVVAFPETTLAIAGDLAAVQAAIDRRAGGGSLNAALAAQIHRVSSQNQVWFVTNVPASRIAANATLTGPNGVPLSAFQGVQQLSGGVTFGQTVLVSGEALTRSEKDATALADVIRFLAGMAQQNSSTEHGKQLSSLANTLQLTTTGSTVKMSVAVPESQIEAMMRQAPQHAPGVRHHRQTERQLD